ncbi:hypothetical protein [Candidatus Nitrotoga arctica]|uniref:CHASE2 domain-containing protein n=1 Tax=Candidatus Nitrotoga arctica TaxID=453162 RepID=A0ABM8YZJ3_9PROT|nr:hypothetical protein [Candidatus Nitrotoga arctica]CAG9932959.1 exported protein of unknown function [Candidatus Nitrotoga arctica]
MNNRFKHWIALAFVAICALTIAANAAAPPIGRPTGGHAYKTDPAPRHESDISRPTDRRPEPTNERVADSTYLERWNTVGSESKKAAFARLLDKRVPGPTLIVATLLDGDYFKRDKAEIDEAWKGKNGVAPDTFPSEPDAIEVYFKLYVGSTIVLIGHVVDGDYVLTDANGKDKARLPMAALSSQAARHGVLLLAFGCETAATGNPFGFLNKINAGGVVRFLAKIDSQPTFRSLFSAMELIGPIKIDLEQGEPLINAMLAPVVKSSPSTSSSSQKETGQFDTQTYGGMHARMEFPKDLYADVTDANLTNDTPLVLRFVERLTLATGFAWVAELITVRLSTSRFILANRTRVNWLGILFQMMRLFRFARKTGLVVAAIIFVVFLVVFLLALSPFLLLALILLYSLYLNLNEKRK